MVIFNIIVIITTAPVICHFKKNKKEKRPLKGGFFIVQEKTQFYNINYVKYTEKMRKLIPNTRSDIE